MLGVVFSLGCEATIDDTFGTGGTPGSSDGGALNSGTGGASGGNAPSGGVPSNSMGGTTSNASGGSANGGSANGGSTNGGSTNGGTASGGTASGGTANANAGSSQGGSANGGASNAGSNAGGKANGGSGGGSGGRVGRGQGGTAASTGGATATGGAPSGGAGSCVQNLSCMLAAPPSTGDAHQDCVDRINQFRTQCACLPALARWTDGEACADQMAQYDSEKNSAHAGFQARICAGGQGQNECPGWGSNAQVVSGCLQSMWNEGPPPTSSCTGACFNEHGHFINMTSTSSTKVACGFYTTSAGKVWAVQNFSR